VLPVALLACEVDRGYLAHRDQGQPAQLRIDTVQSISDDRFYGVRGVLFGSESVAILNGGSRQVFLADSTGVRTVIGRLGRGPGEFQSVTDGVMGGDSLLVLDGVLKRVQLFVAGELAREWFLRDVPGTLRQIVPVGESGLGFAVERRGMGLLTPNQEPVFYRDSIILFVAQGESLERRFWMSGDEGMAEPDDQGRTSYSAMGFRENVAYRMTPTGVVSVEQRSGRVRLMDWNGRTYDIVETEGDTVYVSADELRAYWERIESTARELDDATGKAYRLAARRGVDRWNGRIPRQRFQDLVSDGVTIALREYEFERGRTESWLFLGADGLLIGHLDMPENARLVAIDGDRLAAITRDSMDVESILLLRLLRR
jgi:hypothetical protein